MIVRITVWTMVTCLCALGASAAGSGDGLDLRLRVLDEKAPAGSVVQMKVRTYEVTPISTLRSRFRFDAAVFAAVEGIGIFATNGEVAGAAVIDGNHVAMAYATTEPFTGDDYPFLTVALRIRDDVAVGSRSQFTLDPSALLNGTMVPAQRVPGYGDRRRERRDHRRHSRRWLVSGWNRCVGPWRGLQQPIAAQGRRYRCRLGAGDELDRDPVHAARSGQHDRTEAAGRQSGRFTKYLLLVHARHPRGDERPDASLDDADRSFPARRGRCPRSVRYLP